jgi:hypothetical protein
MQNIGRVAGVFRFSDDRRAIDDDGVGGENDFVFDDAPPPRAPFFRPRARRSPKASCNSERLRQFRYASLQRGCPAFEQAQSSWVILMIILFSPLYTSLYILFLFIS